MAVDGFPFSRGFVALVIAVAMAGRGLKKKSLSKSGAIAAFVVGLVSFLASYRMGITLILFYQSSSSLTKVGNAIKKKLEADHKEGGQRGADQVQHLPTCAAAPQHLTTTSRPANATIPSTGYRPLPTAHRPPARRPPARLPP